MSDLELKVPPDVAWFAVAMLMWFASALTPRIDVGAPYRVGFAALLAAAGVGLIVAARIMLSRAHTTWHPTNPGCTTTLVTAGVFRVSRNPIYLGMLFVLVAWAVVLASPLALALSAIFVLYLNRFQIAPEERALSAIIGNDYRDYARRVRRWL